MYKPTAKAKKKPVHIRVYGKKSNYDAAIGLLPAEGNQEAYKYAYDIGLHDHVEKVEAKKKST
jgi:hypothetical protein